MLRLDSKTAKEKKAAGERIPIFEIDSVEYTIPKVVDAAAVLRYLDAAAERGFEAAVADLLRELVGDEGYEALVNFEGLEPEQLSEVFDMVEQYALSQVEKSMQGKSRRRRSRR